MADDVSDMRVDIGRMAEKMDSLTDTLKEYIKRSEACQGDHETRLRAVEAAALAVAEIATIKTQLAAAEKKIGEIVTAQTVSAVGWKTTARIGGIAGGVIGMICGLVGAVVAVFTLIGGI